MIDVLFSTTHVEQVRRKLACARTLDSTVRLRMFPPRGQPIELAGRRAEREGNDYWGDLEVVEVGRRLLRVRGQDDDGEDFEAHVDPTSALYEYRLLSQEARGR